MFFHIALCTLNLALGRTRENFENVCQESCIIVEIQVGQSYIKAEVFLLESTCSVISKLNTELKIVLLHNLFFLFYLNFTFILPIKHTYMHIYRMN
jgi:hypothetical protein